MSPARSTAFENAVLIRLFRKWAMARESDQPVMPIMHAEAMRHHFQDYTAAAAASLFQIVEAQIGRPLVRECCCSPSYSADERALIGILRHAPVLRPGCGTKAIPHGVPGALCWAARCLCEAMDIEIDAGLTALHASAANSQDCPFESAIKLTEDDRPGEQHDRHSIHR